MTLAFTLIGLALLAVAFALQLVRWLRVLQREHYEARALPRFLGRWVAPTAARARSVERSSAGRPVTLSMVLLVLFVVTVALHRPALEVLVSVLYGVSCPVGLGVRGRTGPLRWTRRATTVAVTASVLAVAIALLGAVSRAPWLGAVLVVWAVPTLLDLSTRLLAPFERRAAQGFVDQARQRLDAVHPLVVGITGSYGKTSTKNHLAELLYPDGGVVASPRSFNNRAGLSRAINEHLVDGTRIFLAEMGTYGPGEIHELCQWCPPTLSIITAIGPVHLERMRSLETIVRAKLEITETATTVVLNGDDPRLERRVDYLRSLGKTVLVAGSTNEAANWRVVPDGRQWTIIHDGEVLGVVGAVAGVQPTNVACALAAASALGLADLDVVSRVSLVRPVASRANVATAPSGVRVIDDTFNANPASAAAALALLLEQPVSGRRVVVTPGLIELGDEQYGENARWARRAKERGVELLAVGRTNARALREGYGAGLHRVDTRDEAVAWVRRSLGESDAVLYLNDLPDHYP